MKDSDYQNLIELVYASGAWHPVNQNGKDLQDQAAEGSVVQFLEVTERDLKYLKCYFALLNYIYIRLPKHFRECVEKKYFYQFLKHIKGDYDVKFRFKDGTQLIEYKSIAFGRMSQKTFEAYVREQLPYIYEKVISELLPEAEREKLIAEVEIQFEKFLR